MKFTLSWLKEYIDTNSSLAEICQKLNNIGLEVENVEDQSASLAPFTVAQIVSAMPHPNSQKLQICQVDTGVKELLQIVCGAKNARANLKVAYAPIDSVIPNGGMKIKKSKIAGVDSNGMLCSASELELGVDGEGIIEIDNKFAVGTKISEVFGSGDVVIEINVTPNRGDCLGVYGIARDLAAAGIGVLKSPKIPQIKGSFVSPISTKINSQNCYYFSGYCIKNVNNVSSPKWLKDRLSAIGVNSISAIVDVTNYVMFAFNQPLHGYDADKLSGNIVVRDANVDENFLSLKNQNYRLSGDELVIADDSGVIGLAGIMGGMNTAVSESTKNIFLEAAFFKAENIAKTGRKLNILSDARYRFERSIDGARVADALKMAADLILEICGSQTKVEISEVIEIKNYHPVATPINFPLDKIKQILGIIIDRNFVVNALQKLGFAVDDADNNILKVTPPTHRSDVAIAEDLIEEIIRIYGLNNVIAEPLSSRHPIDNSGSNLEIISNKLCANGFVENISWSFIDDKIAAVFASTKPELFVTNPIAAQMNYMRPTLLAGLLTMIAKNQARGFNDLMVFEVGKIFLGVKKDQQKNVAAAIRIGKNKEKNHYQEQRDFDIFDIKKDLFDCLEALGFSVNSLSVTSEVPSYYHPHRAGAVKLGRNVIAYFGELHPIVNKKLDVTGRANAFELLIDDLPVVNKKSATKKPFVVSDFQAVKRDFAFVVGAEIAVGDLLKKVAEVDKNLITEVNLFDIYQGDKLADKLGIGKKSIAFSINIQPQNKTLTSEEINQISDKVIAVVAEKFSGMLRE